MVCVRAFLKGYRKYIRFKPVEVCLRVLRTELKQENLLPPIKPGADGPLGQPYPKGLEDAVRKAQTSWIGERVGSCWMGGYSTEAGEGQCWADGDRLAYCMFCVRKAFQIPPLKKILLRLLSRTDVPNPANKQMLQLLQAAAKIEYDAVCPTTCLASFVVCLLVGALCLLSAYKQSRFVRVCVFVFVCVCVCVCSTRHCCWNIPVNTSSARS